MPERKHDFGDALLAGPRLGLAITYPAPGIIERIGPDWDWLWIDAQHGELDYADALAAVRAADLVRRPAIVRVPGHAEEAICKTLDMRPAGVMVPMVEHEDQARLLVRAAKFPPLGSRSYGGRRPVDLFGRGYAHPDQPAPLLVCQIESPAGLDHAETIAAVEGVDALFFGPDDMALRAGLPMDQPRPVGYFDDALRQVARAAASHGKICGSVFTTPDALKAGVELGYRMIVVGGETALLATASQERAHALRGALSRRASGKKND